MSLVDRIKSLFGGTDAPTESGTGVGAAQSEESAVGNGDSDSDPEPHDPIDSGESDPKSVPADSADAQSNSDEVVNLAKSLSVGETVVINNETACHRIVPGLRAGFSAKRYVQGKQCLVSRLSYRIVARRAVQDATRISANPCFCTRYWYQKIIRQVFPEQ